MSEEKPGRCVAGSEIPRAGTVSDAHKLNADNLYRAKCAAAEIELPKRLPVVSDYRRRHVAAGRNWRPVYAYKLLELWELLHDEKPQTILELGSGCTTALFNDYARQNGCALTTVDENSEYQSKVLGDIEGWRGVAVVAAVEHREYQRGVYRNYAFECKAVDFLYVDGPTNQLEDKSMAICTDAMQCDARTIAFDIRRESVEHISHSAFGEKYWWEMSAWQHWWKRKDLPWYLSSLKHHTVARKRA